MQHNDRFMVRVQQMALKIYQRILTPIKIQSLENYYNTATNANDVEANTPAIHFDVHKPNE